MRRSNKWIKNTIFLEYVFFRVFYAELQDWALRRSHFQVLCIDGDLPSASVPIANAAAQCEIIISELRGLHGEGVEVGKEQADVV